jgi:hypothetical protein
MITETERKQRNRERMRRDRAEHPEKYRRSSRRYYARNRLQVRAYQKEYDARPEAAEKRRKRVASYRRIPAEELFRLREPSNRRQSLDYGPDHKVVCVECGFKGHRLGSHVFKCDVPQSPAQYAMKWGFAEKDLVSARLREKIAASRTGRKLGPDHKRRKVTDPQILKIAALGLPMAESAKQLGISAMAFHRRAKRLGITSDYPERRRHFFRYLIGLVSKIKAQETLPNVEQIAQHFADECANGTITRELRIIFPRLEAELAERPDLIQQLRESTDTKLLISLVGRVLKRSRSHTPSSPTMRPKKKRGRHAIAKEHTEAYKIGQRVEAQLEICVHLVESRKALPRSIRRNAKLCEAALLKARFCKELILASLNAREAVVIARKFVHHSRVLSHEAVNYETVCRYHRTFLASSKPDKN